VKTQSLNTEVLVCGGGAGGVSAAIAAARAGAKVILCQNRSVLGGNASSEIRMHIVGADANGFRNKYPIQTEARESGLVEELRLRQACENPARSPHGIDLVLYDMVRSEPNITLLLDTQVSAARVEGKRIVSIRAERPAHEEAFEITASQFIDASGDSGMAVAAGNPFRRGRESRAEFGEQYALEKADNWCLGSTVLFQAVKMDHPVPFTAPSWARKFTEEDLANRPHSLGQTAGGEECGFEYGFWWLEWGGHLDTIADNDHIRHELLSIAYGIWDHLKNGGQHGAENWVLTWVGMLPGKRESRRLIGRKTLTEQDVLNAPDAPDAIAYGGWPMDLHPPKGVDAPLEEPCTQIEVPHLYPIPLSCCASGTLENLWFSGRNISATHVAFASTRVMATCFAMGQGTGIAAAKAAAQGKGTAEACTSPELIQQIQQEILRQDGFLIGVPNADPLDLARSAKVSASDHRQNGDPQNVTDGFTRITTGPHGTRPGAMPEGTHRWMSEKLPAWLELEWDKPVTLSRLQLTFDTGLHRWFSLTQSDGVHARNIWGPQPESIRDYNLIAETPTGPLTLAEVRGNFLRQRIHNFSSIATTRLRIEVLASNGNDHARIVEVRAYR
jgi:hypothetical protein